jgi:hypothetical protein
MKIYTLMTICLMFVMVGLAVAQTDVADIAAARTLGDGTNDVRITGEMVVVSGTNAPNPGRNQFVVQDSSGAGILMDDSGGFVATVYVKGDVLQDLRGNIAAFTGLLQLVPATDQPTLVRQGDPLPAPTVVNGSTDGKVVASTLIRVNGGSVNTDCFTATWQSGGSRTNITINGAPLPFDTIRLEKGAGDVGGINGTVIDNTFDIIGVAGQFDFSGAAGYQIQPRTPADFISVTPADDPNIEIAVSLLDLGSITADQTTNADLTITNHGASSTLNISAANITGGAPGNFSVGGGQLPLAIPSGGGSDTLTVTFAPASLPGQYDATIDLTTDDPAHATCSVDLTAVATAPVIGGVDYTNPTGAIFATQAQYLAPSDQSGQFAAQAISVDPSDGSLVAIIEETSSVSGSSSSGSGGNGSLVDIVDGNNVTLIATEAQMLAGVADGSGHNPNNIAVGSNGTVYVSDFELGTVDGNDDDVFSVVAGTPPTVTQLKIANGTNGNTSLGLIESAGVLVLAGNSGFGTPNVIGDGFHTIPVGGGATSLVVTSPTLAAFTGVTPADTGINGFAVDPTTDDVIAWDYGNFNGSDKLLRIADITGTPVITEIADFSGGLLERCEAVTVGPDGTIFLYERQNAPNGLNGRLLMLLGGTTPAITYTAEEIEALTGADMNNGTDDIFSRNVGMLAAKESGQDVVLYIANATNDQSIVELTFPFVTAVNEADQWSTYE